MKLGAKVTTFLMLQHGVLPHSCRRVGRGEDGEGGGGGVGGTSSCADIFNKTAIQASNSPTCQIRRKRHSRRIKIASPH